MNYNIIKPSVPDVNSKLGRLLELAFRDYKKILERFTKKEFDEIWIYVNTLDTKS